MLVSLMCSAIREAIESLLKTRAVFLERGIRELLHDIDAKGITQSFFNHPLINNLFSGSFPSTPGQPVPPRKLGRGLPSYIPARNFALALMDIAAKGRDLEANASGSSPLLSLDSIRQNVTNIGNERVQRVLLNAIDTAQGDFNKAQANIEAWFDASMDRVSGWYKRCTQFILFGVGLAIAIGLNIDSIRIADYLAQNQTARAAVVAIAEKTVSQPLGTNPPVTGTAAWAEAEGQLNQLKLPIGWDPATKNGVKAWEPFTSATPFGWLLTAFATMLGAPFWFDILNRLMVIRATVKPHEKSPEEASEDRQQPNPSGPSTSTPGGAPPPGAPTGPGSVPQPTPIVPSPDPLDETLDGCEVQITDPLEDENLPVAAGGVA